MAAPLSNFSNSTTDDGSALAIINKRLRTLRKKLNHISQLEESLAQGKPLNEEQDELLRSKPCVIAAIDELETMRGPLLQAFGDEIRLSLEKIGGNSEALDRADRIVENECASVASDVLSLLYFGALFDRRKPTPKMASKIMKKKMRERNCITAGDSAADAPLTKQDLDMIALMRNLMISPSRDSSISHKEALVKCVEHAKLWFANSEQPIDPNSAITYAELREKIEKIKTLDYFTTPTNAERTVEADAVGGNDAPFHVPVPEPGTSPSNSTTPTEGSAARSYGEGGSDSNSAEQPDSHQEA